MVAIIDYGMGNVASVQKALNFLKIESIITDDHDLIKKAKTILLPGVGSFVQGMKNLKDRGIEVFEYKVLSDDRCACLLILLKTRWLE